jgi:hypothetical protein
MNPVRTLQNMEKFRVSPDFQKLKSIQEHPTFYEICRFLEHEIARTLPEIYPEWDEGVIAGCTIRICSTDSEYRLMPYLWNLAVDLFALKALHELDLDTPCHTVGDIANGKLGLIPTESIRRYGESHKNQILNWLASRQYDNTIVNNTYVERLKMAFSAAAKKHDGGGI